MKLLNLFALFLAFVGSASAQSLPALSGSFAGDCSQFQDRTDQGFTTEKYDFGADTYRYQRTWFQSPDCEGVSFRTDVETGTVKIGPVNLNNGFNPAGTREINFSHAGNQDQGLFWLSETGSTLRVSRGFVPNLRNTMLSIFSFQKQ